MQNAKWNSIDEFDDISTKDQYRVAKEAGLSDEAALEACSKMSRDNARTPMQWDTFAEGAQCLITNMGRTVFDRKIVLNPYEAFVLYKKD